MIFKKKSYQTGNSIFLPSCQNNLVFKMFLCLLILRFLGFSLDKLVLLFSWRTLSWFFRASLIIGADDFGLFLCSKYRVMIMVGGRRWGVE